MKNPRELEALEQEASILKKRLSEAELSDLGTRRQNVAAPLDVAAMTLYESLRSSRGVVAVALV